MEDEIYELTGDDAISRVEVIAVPKVSETAHTIIIKGYTKDGACKKAVLENMYVNSPARITICWTRSRWRTAASIPAAGRPVDQRA